MSQRIVRKQMRLNSYDYTKENVVFTTVCVNHREKLLGSIPVPQTETDIPKMEFSPIGLLVDRFTVTVPGIDKYVIMPNHVHMIVFVPEGKHISTVIRSWKTLITKELGYSIWQRTYYDHVIRDEQDYLTKCNYIENNPVKWSLDPYYQK